MATKDYNSINFKNSAIDRMSGKFGKNDGPGDKLKKQGQKMKAEGQKMKAEGQKMKSEGKKMKELGKQSISPAKNVIDEAETRMEAYNIKGREQGYMYGVRSKATGSENRTVAQQKVLDKDMAIIRAKEAAAKIKAQKEAAAKAAEKKKVASMQKKGGYKG